VLAWSYGLWQIRTDRELTLASSENQLTLSTTAFANHVTAMINDGAGAAIAGANELRALDHSSRLTNEQMGTVLARMLTGGEYVQTLFIATPTRFAEANRAGAKNLGSGFVADMFSTQEQTWVGQPLNIEHDDANVIIPVAKRVPDLNGETTWAGAMLSFASLDALYRTLPVEYTGLALTHRSGTLLVRVPTLRGFKFSGTNVNDYPSTREYLRQAPKPLVAYVAPDPFSGKPRQFVVSTIENYPLRTTASRDIDNSLIAWRTRKQNSLLMLVAGTLTLAFLTSALFILLRRRFDALLRSESRFYLAVAGSNNGIWDWDAKSGRVYYSPRLRELLGVAPDEPFPDISESFYARMHPDDVRPTELAVQRHLLHRDPYDIEYRMQTGTGYRWFHARAQAAWDQKGNPLRMAGAISDIHERRTTELSLRQAQEREIHAREEFSQHLLLAQEQERQRLANELHDSVGQNLSLIKSRALLFLQQPNLPDTATHHITALSELTSEVIAEVRAVAQNLRPLHIEQLGITDALDTLLTKVDDSSELTIEQRLENVDDVMTGEAATHLFRIVQEALNNILKHARAKHCRVWLERDLHCVRLTISDNGVGFDTNAAVLPAGLGLASITQRCRMLGARLEIKSQIGAGCVMHIEIPIAESKDALPDSDLATQSDARPVSQ
jgi:two-component system sensor histidine kinase UhpB